MQEIKVHVVSLIIGGSLSGQSHPLVSQMEACVCLSACPLVFVRP